MAIRARAHTVLQCEGDLDKIRYEEGNASHKTGSDIDLDPGTDKSALADVEHGNVSRTRMDADSFSGKGQLIKQQVLPNIAPTPAPSLSKQPEIPTLLSQPRECSDWSREDSKLFVEYVRPFGKCPGQRAEQFLFCTLHHVHAAIEKAHESRHHQTSQDPI